MPSCFGCCSRPVDMDQKIAYYSQTKWWAKLTVSEKYKGELENRCAIVVWFKVFLMKDADRKAYKAKLGDALINVIARGGDTAQTRAVATRAAQTLSIRHKAAPAQIVASYFSNNRD